MNLGHGLTCVNCVGRDSSTRTCWHSTKQTCISRRKSTSATFAPRCSCVATSSPHISSCTLVSDLMCVTTAARPSLLPTTSRFTSDCTLERSRTSVRTVMLPLPRRAAWMCTWRSMAWVPPSRARQTRGPAPSVRKWQTQTNPCQSPPLHSYPYRESSPHPRHHLHLKLSPSHNLLPFSQPEWNLPSSPGWSPHQPTISSWSLHNLSHHHHHHHHHSCHHCHRSGWSTWPTSDRSTTHQWSLTNQQGLKATPLMLQQWTGTIPNISGWSTCTLGTLGWSSQGYQGLPILFIKICKVSYAFDGKPFWRWECS